MGPARRCGCVVVKEGRANSCLHGGFAKRISSDSSWSRYHSYDCALARETGKDLNEDENRGVCAWLVTSVRTGFMSYQRTCCIMASLLLMVAALPRRGNSCNTLEPKEYRHCI